MTKTKIVGWFKDQAKLLVAVLFSAIIGGATTAAVLAATGDGVIRACYRNSNQTLSLPDSSGNCAANETAISWNQQGPAGPQGPVGPQGPKGDSGSNQAASGYIRSDGTLDQTHSVNVLSIKTAYSNPADPSSGQFGYCIKVPFTPILGQARGINIDVANPNLSQQTEAVDYFCGLGSGYNAVIEDEQPENAGTVPFVISADPTYN